MRYLLPILLLLALPAQAQMQFDSQPGAPAGGVPQAVQDKTPGIMWLQRTPASLFDLGMMELTAAATKTSSALFDITGAVAEYQQEKGLIALSFYARTAYSEDNCKFVLNKLRDSMFPKRDNPAVLAADLASYFSSYGATIPGRPSSVGAELVTIMRFAVFMPGGACQMPLYGSDEIGYWVDPNAPPPQTLAPAATPAPAPVTQPNRPARR